MFLEYAFISDDTPFRYDKLGSTSGNPDVFNFSESERFIGISSELYSGILYKVGVLRSKCWDSAPIYTPTVEIQPD